MHSIPRGLATEVTDDGSVRPKTSDSAVLENQEEMILDWLTDAHFTVDDAWRLVEISPRAGEFLGSPQAELVGRVLWDVLPGAPGTGFETESRAAMQTRKPRRIEAYSLDHLGLVADVLLYPQPHGLRVYYRDITLEELNLTLEQRVAERTAEVQQLADQLRALAAELTRVEHRERRRLALILHDHVQQLLVAAKMQVEAIGRGISAEHVAPAAERASSILKDAIAASRTLSVELSPPVLHQSGLAAGLAWLAEHFEAKHGFTVHFQDESQGQPTTEDVRLLLFESTRELLFNCVKHSGVDEAYVTLTRTESGQLELIVEDKGRGFDPVSPLGDRLNRRSLGLFSIQQRLAYFGGRMEMEGAPGAGVRVTLFGPEPDPGTPVSGSQSTCLIAGRPSCDASGDGRIRVLLVDDHKIMREGLAGLIRQEPDIEVVGEAENATQALELAAALSPDVIVMDVNLPRMNGIEATRRLTVERPRVKIVGLSMHGEEEIGRSMRAAGAEAYLPKGGPMADLIAAIRACGQCRR